jgi:hypothetical protein
LKTGYSSAAFDNSHHQHNYRPNQFGTFIPESSYDVNFSEDARQSMPIQKLKGTTSRRSVSKLRPKSAYPMKGK